MREKGGGAMPQVRLPDFTMHYVEVGTGSLPIVFVHGFISTRNWWQPTLERLASDRYHAYAIDLRAAGESEQTAEGHTLAQYAQDLQAFADAMGLQRFVLVGHSMGGGVAMQYALDHPERLAALLLVDPLAPFGTDFAPMSSPRSTPCRAARRASAQSCLAPSLRRRPATIWSC